MLLELQVPVDQAVQVELPVLLVLRDHLDQRGLVQPVPLDLRVLAVLPGQELLVRQARLVHQDQREQELPVPQVQVDLVDLVDHPVRQELLAQPEPPELVLRVRLAQAGHLVLRVRQG